MEELMDALSNAETLVRPDQGEGLSSSPQDALTPSRPVERRPAPPDPSEERPRTRPRLEVPDYHPPGVRVDDRNRDAASSRPRPRLPVWAQMAMQSAPHHQPPPPHRLGRPHPEHPGYTLHHDPFGDYYLPNNAEIPHPHPHPHNPPRHRGQEGM